MHLGCRWVTDLYFATRKMWDSTVEQHIDIPPCLQNNNFQFIFAQASSKVIQLYITCIFKIKFAVVHRPICQPFHHFLNYFDHHIFGLPFHIFQLVPNRFSVFRYAPLPVALCPYNHSFNGSTIQCSFKYRNGVKITLSRTTKRLIILYPQLMNLLREHRFAK